MRGRNLQRRRRGAALETGLGMRVSAFPLEELNRTFVLLRRLTALEGAKVAALSGLRVFLA